MRTSAEFALTSGRSADEPRAINPTGGSSVITLASDLVAAREPRVKSSNFDAHIQSDHPFFWSGYLLVAPGTIAAAPEAPKKIEVAAEKK